jgi:hypothetical protein
MDKTIKNRYKFLAAFFITMVIITIGCLIVIFYSLLKSNLEISGDCCHSERHTYQLIDDVAYHNCMNVSNSTWNCSASSIITTYGYSDCSASAMRNCRG